MSYQGNNPNPNPNPNGMPPGAPGGIRPDGQGNEGNPIPIGHPARAPGFNPNNLRYHRLPAPVFRGQAPGPMPGPAMGGGRFVGGLPPNARLRAAYNPFRPGGFPGNFFNYAVPMNPAMLQPFGMFQDNGFRMPNGGQPGMMQDPAAFAIRPEEFPPLPRANRDTQQFRTRSEEFPPLQRANGQTQPILAAAASAALNVEPATPVLPTPPVEGAEALPAGAAGTSQENLDDSEFGIKHLAFLNALGRASGDDLSTFGIDLCSQTPALQTFQGPFQDRRTPAAETQVNCPQEFKDVLNLVNQEHYGGKLKLGIENMIGMFDESTLFYIFYTFGGKAQLLAAIELFKRNWRFHKEQQKWMTKRTDAKNEVGLGFERGKFIVFESAIWRTVEKEDCLEYAKVEAEPPQIPPEPEIPLDAQWNPPSPPEPQPPEDPDQD